MRPGVAERTLSQTVPAVPADVRRCYVDLDNIVELHPLVVDVGTVSRRALADGYEQTYRIKDVVPLGFLRLPITYTAVLTVPQDGPVRAEARQFPAVRLVTAVTFDPVPDGTLLTERIRIMAPRPLLGVTVRQAVAAHTEMLAALRRRFQTG